MSHRGVKSFPQNYSPKCEHRAMSLSGKVSLGVGVANGQSTPLYEDVLTTPASLIWSLFTQEQSFIVIFIKAYWARSQNCFSTDLFYKPENKTETENKTFTQHCWL